MFDRRRVLLSFALTAPLALAGCGLVLAIIAIPFRILGRIFTIRIGSEGAASIEEELRAGGIRIERYELDATLDEELTFTATLEVEKTVTAVSGLAAAQRAELSYDPASQRLELLAAQVQHADGTVVAVEPADAIDSPSRAAADAPEFVSTRTLTVLFPQLQVGSRTFVQWRLDERGRSALGINFAWRPPFALPVEVARLRIRHPPSVALRAAKRGDFAIDVRQDGARTLVEATLERWPGLVAEPAMVAPSDVCPLFVATTIESWEQVGAMFHAAVEGDGRTQVTPEIAALAERVAGSLSGEAAARALHRHVACNVNYVAVHLDEASAWIPRPASEVLRTGYGDCKDQVALLVALLRARGIEAEAALVRRQLAFEPMPLPTPLQFDHCIAYLPQLDLWSDPTDPLRDLGELEVALSDQLAVIATKEGRVARTPAGRPEANTYVAKHVATLRSDGTLEGTSELSATGRCAARIRGVLRNAPNAEVAAEDFLSAVPESGTGSLESPAAADLAVPLRCTGAWKSDVPVELGDPCLVPIPSGIDLVSPSKLRALLASEGRRFPLVVSAVDLQWTIEVALPAGYSVRRLPNTRAVETEAGAFSSRYESRGGDVVVATRRLRIAKDRFAPQEVEGVRRLLREFLADARAPFVAGAVRP